MGRDVAVTGIGVVCPIGRSVEEFSTNLFSGESGVVAIRGSAVPHNFPVPYAALVDTSRAPGSGSRDWSDLRERTRSLLAPAIQEALGSSGLEGAIDGLVGSGSKGYGFETIQAVLRRQISEPSNYEVDFIADFVNEHLRNRGHGPIPPLQQVLMDAACSSGTQAIGTAMRRIRHGFWNSAIVAAVDARVVPSNLMSFHLLKALATEDVPAAMASRPFDAQRSGFVRGEGAAVLILESLETATRRGAPVLGLVAGYGNTADAHRLTDGRDDVMCVVRAMHEAIADAGLLPKDVRVISAHGTATRLNDQLETKAIKELFADTAGQLAITALKSQIGHTTIAAGAIETVACLLMLKEQKVAPTINYQTPDPECDLFYTPKVALDMEFETVLNNSFGFGGQNNCLLLRRYHGR